MHSEPFRSLPQLVVPPGVTPFPPSQPGGNSTGACGPAIFSLLAWCHQHSAITSAPEQVRMNRPLLAAPGGSP